MHWSDGSGDWLVAWAVARRRLLLVVAEENADYRQRQEGRSLPRRALVGRGSERVAAALKRLREKVKALRRRVVVGFRS